MAGYDPTKDPDPIRACGTIANMVGLFVDEAEGRFYTFEVYEYCGVRKDRIGEQAVRQALQREKRRGRIEAAGDRAGCYRRVEREFETIDLASLGEEPAMEVALPLGVHRLVEIFPKDLIVFAGIPNAGKTAFMLEAVRMNMNRFQCFYFSTELGARTARMRISKHPHTPLQEWKFNFVESFRSYVDVVQPDAMNLIDYVEVADGEAFKIPSILGGIQRRVQKGVALVALQKNPGADHAVGGHQTLAKPALFVSLESGTMKILKAKNWRSEINPNGYSIRFKIRNGIELIKAGEWTAP